MARQRADQGADLPGLGAVASDVVAFCREGERIRSEVDRLFEFVREREIEFESSFDPQPLLPFAPVSFRDFMLFEEHAIAAARGLVERFMPRAWRLVSLYESLLGRPPGRLRPKPIWYERPIYYVGSHTSFFTEGDTVPWPSYTRALDYELELGVVLCRPLRDATPDEALRAIGGFVVVNDFSARDVQYREMTSGFGPVKAKNFANAMSAELVTADEILRRVGELTAEVRVNGRSWGRGTTAGMYHSLGEITLPGCSGMETGQWLSPGDEIELEIDGVGTLRNVIGTPAP
jgi:uncharacterized protein YjeT (DUF2065 family)